jgi:hypothetical protein
MLAIWESVTDLRRIEFIALLVGMITPVLCGTILLTVRQRVKTLIDQSNQSQTFAHHESVQKLETLKQRLESDLVNTQKGLSALRRVTAPRQLTQADGDLLIEKLRGVKAAPVIVSAYSFEEESYDYAEQIAGALRQAGWDVTLNKASMNDFKGVSLGSVNLMRKPLSGLRELAEALATAHVDVHQREIAPDTIAGSLQDGSLLVVVGRK